MRGKVRPNLKALKYIALTILLLNAALLLGSFFLPRQWRVERSAVIAAKPEAVWEFIASFKRWPEWTAWSTEADPDVKFTYEGPAEGVGAISKWNGPRIGGGRLAVKRSEPATGLWYEFTFDGERSRTQGQLALSAEAAGTRVTWTSEGDLGPNPLARYSTRMIDKTVGGAVEQSLAKLKTKVESSAGK